MSNPTKESILKNPVFTSTLELYPAEHREKIVNLVSEKLDVMLSQTVTVIRNNVSVTMDMMGYVTEVKINRIFMFKSDKEDLVKCFNEVLDRLPLEREKKLASISYEISNYCSFFEESSNIKYNKDLN